MRRKDEKLSKAFAGAIRKARISDLDAIFSIDQNAFPATETWPRDDWAECIKESMSSANTIVLVAMDGEKMAGCAVALREEDGHGEIASIAVTEDYRGQGLGKKLLESVSRNLLKQGVDKIMLQVRPDNASAIHLYETSGFVKTAHLPGYYPDGDALEMTRLIKPRKSSAKPSAPR